MEQWSEFSELSEMTFNNLRFGDYVFKVRSKIGDEFSFNQKLSNFQLKGPGTYQIL